MSRKQIGIIGLVLCMAFAMIIPAAAQSTSTPQPTATTTPAPLMTASTSLFATSNFLVNVRSGPGRQYTVLGLVRPADALDITGKLADGTWLRVNFNGQEGWVLANLFKISGDMTTAPEAVAGSTAVLRTATTSSTTPGAVIVIAKVDANLRALPAQTSDVLAVIPFNTQLTVTGRTAANNWVQVTFNNQTGWVSSSTLIFTQGVLSTAPLFDANGTAVPATAVPTSMPTPESTTSP
jgi:uncharacterized protein YraI